MISSRGARGLSDLGRYVFRTASLRLFPECFIKYPCKARYLHRTDASLAQRLDANIACRSTGQNIVNQNYVTPLQPIRPAPVDGYRTLERAFTCFAPHPAQHWRGLLSDQHVDCHPTFAVFFQAARQQSRLIEPPSPKPPTVQRNRDKQWRLLIRLWQFRRHQLSQLFSQRDLAAVLERKDQLARSIVIKRCCGDPGMERRISKANRALRRTTLHAWRKWPSTRAAGGLCRDREICPAGAAQTGLCRQRLSAKRTPRWKDKIDQRRERIPCKGRNCGGATHSHKLHRLRETRKRGREISMNQRQVPRIFSNRRRSLRAQRAAQLAKRGGSARWLYREMQDDLIERLDFMRHEAGKTLLIGHEMRELATVLGKSGKVQAMPELDEEQPIAASDFDLIVSLGRLDTVNDLPGALVHIRNALAPGGLTIAQIVGAGSLTALREIMMAADGDRPAARIHPQIDDRAATALLQRAGFAKQVVDTHKLTVRYSSLERLVSDLREQALNSALQSPAPYVGKAGLARAHAKFDELREDDGKVAETFQILTLTGWK